MLLCSFKVNILTLASYNHYLYIYHHGSFLSILKLNINEKLHYLLFASEIFHSVCFLTFITYVIMNVRKLFFAWGRSICCMNVNSCWWTLGCLQFLTIKYEATINIYVQVFVWTQFLISLSKFVGYNGWVITSVCI